tara:strand:+ start:233 stop:853 length:621 start_codon:yes stop_codon:yes gene_type:complete
MGIKLKNVILLDKLVYSDKLEEKEIGKSFQGFPLEQFKGSPPPKNSSLVSFNEMRNLENINADIDIQAADNVEKYFEDNCKGIGIEYPKEYIGKILDDSVGVILHLKNYYNRPRPAQLAKALGLKFHEEPLASSKTPSFPSGHSIQGRLVSIILSEIYPEHKESLMLIGNAISTSRLLAKVHYESDSIFGLQVGEKMAKYYLDKSK